MKKITIRDISFTALFAAVLSVLSIIQIPTPWGVPFTLQTFAVALCGYVLGRKYGTVATLVYVLLGLVGLPVYAGMTAGPGVLFGTSGGYLFGFIPMAFLCGLGVYLAKSKEKKIVSYALAIGLGILGLLVCHILGMTQLKFVLSCSWLQAALWGTIPYLVKDILSVVLAYVVGLAVRKGLKAANIEIAL